ncbi:DsrE/DsrF-like family protein [Idiomarina sp. A28L]|uniref:DsrE family protein n=1 Tax=Idiomarina sp. A28L TaxID=1036674 RepID=UPI00021388FC|nr:DsrE family protein [Idiomarina sp. A28L]EGN75761.1 DsrE/DsrF-like family protein [Idiomarina sp. A28L]
MLMFHFTKPASHASARQGLDMLLMALSLDQPCCAVYSGKAILQLLEPKGSFDPLKKLGLLDAVFDFAEIYVDSASLAENHLLASSFRVPVKVIDSLKIEQLNQQAKHKLQF